MNIHHQEEKQALLACLQKIQPEAQLSSLEQLQKKPSHQHCMICSQQAVLGLKINHYSTADLQVWGYIKGTIHHQGYQGILHGGFLAALLDGVMCQALFKQNIEAVTADMNIRYLNEIPLNSDILIRGKVISSRSPLYKVEGELYVNGVSMVKSSSRFMKKGSVRNSFFKRKKTH